MTEAVVLDGYTENSGDLSREGLETIGSLTVYDRTPVDKVLERIRDIETVYTSRIPISAETIVKCSSLRFIGVLTTGCDVIDTAVAKANRVVVSNIPTYGADAVTQYAITLLLELCHHIGEHSDCAKVGEQTHNQDWCFWKHPLMELTSKSFGVIGFGGIGRRTAQIVQVLGMNVLAFDEYPNRDLETEHCRYISLDQLPAETDVVSLHCPLFPSTEGVINKDAIAKMKDRAKIINTSRDPPIVKEDLKEGLNNGKTSGVAVDMVSTGPVREDNPLLGAKSMIITPRIAWTPREFRQRLVDIAVDNLRQFVDGKPQDVVNRQGRSKPGHGRLQSNVHGYTRLRYDVHVGIFHSQVHFLSGAGP